jgi:hypothetical protein
MEREGIYTKVKIKMDEVTPDGVDMPFDDLIGPILDECAKEVAEVAPLHLLSPFSLVNKTLNRMIDNDVATLGIAGHPYLVGDEITVSGITGEASYNGDFIVTAVTADTISYALSHADENLTTDTTGTVTYKTIVTGNKAYIAKPLDFLRLYEMKFPLWQKSVRETVKPGTVKGDIQDNPYLASGIGRPTVMLQTTYPAGGSLKDYLVCAKVEVLAVPVALYVKAQKPEELPEQLIDSLTWLAAAKVVQVGGRLDLAQGLNQQYQLSLAQLAKA